MPHPLRTTTEQAHQMGHRAYRDGKPRSANPWPDGVNAGAATFPLQSAYVKAERDLADAWGDGHYLASVTDEDR